MKTWLLSIWDSLRTSFWFVPALLAVGAVVLAFVTAAIDRRVDVPLEGALRWLHADNADAVRALLSTIMGSAITVLSVVFSITIVSLTLAASQFGPRLLRNFMRDKVTQVVLGIFSATFVYALLVMQMVHGSDEDFTFVPHISVLVGVVLSITSLGVLIYFIHHTARSIQAPQVIARVSAELHGAIRRGAVTGDEYELLHTQPDEVAVTQLRQSTAIVDAGTSGYVQLVQIEDLLKRAREYNAMFEVQRRAGHFIIRGQPLIHVFPEGELTDERAARLRSEITIGDTRTDTQDIEFSVRQLVEVALRALSPGINDPYTAVTCIDRLSAALAELAQRHLPDGYVYDDDGRLRLIMPVSTFAGVADVAFHQIRQHGAHQPAIALRLLETICDVADFAHEADQVAALQRHAGNTFRSAMGAVPELNDRAEIAARYHVVRSRLAAVHAGLIRA